ncbi:hypothetical protein A1O3_08808 [Capronia epimyces CBS 606.96]|uniref:SAM domain-containing protein n=1 Tax=Capronia epimyces CBS 606.96 TaxID=1182542 RepID=W9XQQ1_9EURO|nr:uncharacterized protein A1O3_08808 [Capronia epimyces CBS 606.96]EXJ79306.1 hypothetical protein A1O3_08808 [Capronia epimyces CBS 606.96]
MEWSFPSQLLQSQSVEMLQKPSTLSFLNPAMIIPRPVSEATEIFDTDSEDDSDSAQPPWDSLDDDSQSTVSSQEELPTPPGSGGLSSFEFHFDHEAAVAGGPPGRHPFRHNPEILSNPDDDVFIGLAPVREPKTAAKSIGALNTAVAQLDESQVRDWTPRQVADWMAESGFEPGVVEKFLIHDISGSVLIDLQFEDLKELDISSFGKRHRVMSSIHQLRNSSMISPDTLLSRTPSRSTKSPMALQPPPRSGECQVLTPDRSRSRRRARQVDTVTPAESVSIVGIEQVLPREHKCSKGEDCPKWQKQQRRILRMQRAFEEDARRPISEAPSEALPSVVGSSDALGPSALKITPEALSEVQPRDAQEGVRQFLNFQHIHSPSHSSNPSPPPAASASFASKSAHLAEHLRELPKLTIPAGESKVESPSRTPLPAFQQPTQIQVQLKAQLQGDPYHYGGVASPADIYRLDTPMSATDLPVTVVAIDPCQRDVSQSVPPEMRYGATPYAACPEPIQRCASAQNSPPPPPPLQPRRHFRQTSFTPSVAPVKENDAQARVTESDLVNHQGWMRKRRTTRMLRHEWQDNFCTLVGSKLTMHETHYPDAAPLEAIDVDAYTLHAYAQASGSKLSAAFKKSLLGQGKMQSASQTFTFSLLPDEKLTPGRKLFDKTKSHHFAVDTSKERIEWMRKLMLAKAMKKNDVCQI